MGLDKSVGGFVVAEITAGFFPFQLRAGAKGDVAHVRIKRDQSSVLNGAIWILS